MWKIIATLAVAAGLLAGCGESRSTRVLTGAAGGAAAGQVIAGAPLAGAAIGGGIGAIR
jgi:osmotically inducible lipoprotein OsmB